MGKCKMVSPELARPKAGEALPDLGRDQFFATLDTAPVRVEVPELRGAVYVKPMTGAERAAWEDAVAKAKETGEGNLDVIAGLLTVTVCDAEGSLMFGPEDVDALKAKSTKVLMRLVARAQKVNALTDADIEALEGN